MSRPSRTALAAVCALLLAAPALADAVPVDEPTGDVCVALPDDDGFFTIAECGVEDFDALDARDAVWAYDGSITLTFRSGGGDSGFRTDVYVSPTAVVTEAHDVRTISVIWSGVGPALATVLDRDDDVACTSATASSSGSLHILRVPGTCLLGLDVVHASALNGLQVRADGFVTPLLGDETVRYVDWFTGDAIGADVDFLEDETQRLVRTDAGDDRPVSTARAITDTCGAAAVGTFLDVSSGGVHAAQIACVSGATFPIAGGFADGTYRPGDLVTAGQAAALLVRTVTTAGIEVPVSLTCGDGPIASPVGALVDAGILLDCDASWVVARADMARLTAETIATFGGVTTSADTDWFADDVDLPERFVVSADMLADLGVMTGTQRGRFTPFDDVTRGQTATFLARTLDVLLEG